VARRRGRGYFIIIILLLLQLVPTTPNPRRGKVFKIKYYNIIHGIIVAVAAVHLILIIAFVNGYDGERHGPLAALTTDMIIIII